MEHFINAALFNEKDNMKSVSSCIAVGKVFQGGTGAFDLLLDTPQSMFSLSNSGSSFNGQS